MFEFPIFIATITLYISILFFNDLQKNVGIIYYMHVELISVFYICYRSRMVKRSNVFIALAVIFLVLGIGGLCVVCGMYWATQQSETQVSVECWLTIILYLDIHS